MDIICYYHYHLHHNLNTKRETTDNHKPSVQLVWNKPHTSENLQLFLNAGVEEPKCNHVYENKISSVYTKYIFMYDMPNIITGQRETYDDLSA